MHVACTHLLPQPLCPCALTPLFKPARFLFTGALPPVLFTSRLLTLTNFANNK